jgi:arylsulfatase A-like enzyme
MGMFDKKTFPLPHNFYDDYQGREAAKVQDMSIAKTMIMGYDLKMFGSEGAADKDGNIKRMNAAQRARFNRYYLPVEADLKSKNLSGKALTEWKYQHYMRDYLSTAASLDRNITRTLDYLDKHHLAKNTIVIYLSDQGFYLGEHGWFDKRFIYEESFRTPMVMRYPGVIKPGSVSSDFVMNLDIAPTILDAAGVSIPGDMQGKSMLPVLKDKKFKGREYLYYHYYENGEHSVSPHFGIRNKRYKLIRFYKRVESWELYDLMKDPNEVHNVYGEKDYQKIADQMKKELNKQIEQYDDQDAKKIVEMGI